MAPGFEIPIPVEREAQIWVLAQVPSTSQDPSNFTFCIGRLSHGVSSRPSGGGAYDADCGTSRLISENDCGG